MLKSNIMKKNLKNKLIVLSISAVGLALIPLFASAQVCNPTQNLGDILCKISKLINTVIPVLLALGVLYFVWGVVQYVMASEEEAKKKGRDRMIFGIIGLVVIVSMWGLVGILINTFGLSGTTTYTLPCVPFPPATTC